MIDYRFAHRLAHRYYYRIADFKLEFWTDYVTAIGLKLLSGGVRPLTGLQISSRDRGKRRAFVGTEMRGPVWPPVRITLSVTYIT